MDDYAEFRHFKYLLAVAEHKGFRAAADALHTSQPSLSRQIRDFQEHYKIRLFRRTRGKGVTLTPAGEALTVIARDVLEMRDYAISALDAIHRGDTDVLRVGCSPFVDKDICRTVSTLHKKLMPSASIDVSSADTKALITELRNGQLDAAIVSLPVDDAELKVELLKQEALVVCLPKDHPLAKKPALSGNDLASHLTVFRDPMQHPEAHERLVELLLELGVRFEEHSHASHPHEMQEAILSGSGFALMREGTSLINGLTTRPIIGVEWTFDTAFVYRASRSQILPVLAKSLRKQYARSVIKIAGRKKEPQRVVKEPLVNQRKLFG